MRRARPEDGGGGGVLRGTTRSTSSSSARRRRWPPGWRTAARPGSRCSGRRGAAAAGGLEGLHQGDLRRLRRADRGLCRFTEAAPAKAYIRDRARPIVVKADGLAAGKGVIVAMTVGRGRWPRSTTCSAAPSARPGAEVVIEEFMDGEEASFFVLSDGETVLPLGHRAGPQARLRRRRGAEYRRHGRLFARPGADDGCDAGRWTRSCALIAEMARRGDALSGRALCRADDRRTGRGWSNTTSASATRNARC